MDDGKQEMDMTLDEWRIPFLSDVFFGALLGFLRFRLSVLLCMPSSSKAIQTTTIRIVNVDVWYSNEWICFGRRHSASERWCQSTNSAREEFKNVALHYSTYEVY